MMERGSRAEASGIIISYEVDEALCMATAVDTDRAKENRVSGLTDGV